MQSPENITKMCTERFYDSHAGERMLLADETRQCQTDGFHSLSRRVRWRRLISQVHSWGNNALDKRSAQLG